MRLLAPAALLLAGCVTMAPQDMARQSNYDVCRFTMGGPHSQVAHDETRRRNLDCTPYYPAINARMQAQDAATQNYINSLNRQQAPMRPPVQCRSYRVGNAVQTDCN